jgi:uncharacterized protein YlxW (UPF0749 family)
VVGVWQALIQGQQQQRGVAVVHSTARSVKITQMWSWLLAVLLLLLLVLVAVQRQRCSSSSSSSSKRSSEGMLVTELGKMQQQQQVKQQVKIQMRALNSLVQQLAAIQDRRALGVDLAAVMHRQQQQLRQR